MAWDLPARAVHDQQVLNHPAGKISIGMLGDSGVPLAPSEGRVYGVHGGISHRHLMLAGWTVAAVGPELLDVTREVRVERHGVVATSPRGRVVVLPVAWS